MLKTVFPWKSSYPSVIVVALCIGVLTLAVSIAIDWALHGRGLIDEWSLLGSTHPVYASDLFAALAAAVVSGLALGRLQAQRRELLRRMQAVEDVNHHVRNALTAVTLSAALHENAELNERVRDASERIDWVLRDVLPRTIERMDEAMDPTQQWSQGKQLDD